MLASLITKRLDSLPGAPGAWVVVRKLGWKALRTAQEAQQQQAYALLSQLPKETLEAAGSVTADQIAAFKRDPAAKYDRAALLLAGIVSWSLEAAITPETIDDLEEPVAACLAAAIVELSEPPRDEAARKNV